MLRELARIKGGCPEVRAFLDAHESLEAAWKACGRGSWMLGLLARLDRWWSPRLVKAADAVWALAFLSKPEREGDGRAGCALAVSQLAQAVAKELGEGAEQRMADAVRAAVPCPEDHARKPMPARRLHEQRYDRRLKVKKDPPARALRLNEGWAEVEVRHPGRRR